MTAKDKVRNEAFEDRPDPLECMLTPPELAFLAGTTTAIIEQLVSLDLLEPSVRSETVLFGVESIVLVRKILRLQRHLQIGFDSMAFVFDLLDRIDALERKITGLEKGQ